jgi:ATP-binding cassette subfamily F protein 3
MSLVRLEGITLAFGSTQLLDNIAFQINAGERMALSGANGSGKTTLLKIICGMQKPDSGKVHISKRIKISYLPQAGTVGSGLSLYDEMNTIFKAEADLVLARERTAEELADSSVDGERRNRLLREYARLEEEIQACGYHLKDKKIDQVLTGLGFARERYDTPCGDFSDGWRMRIALAKVLLEKADLLLLDEPTNYLDLETREWLKDYILRRSGGVILVSHDRYFLDCTVGSVAELDRGSLVLYRGNYTAYEQERTSRLAASVKQRRQEAVERTRAERFIERFRAKATKASAVQSRIKMLQKAGRTELPGSVKRIHFRFPEAPHSGRKVLEVSGLCKSYDGRTVFTNVDLEIERGDRIAFVGLNGAGKSTLLRILAGQAQADTGVVKPGAGVAVGYFSHNDAALYTSERTIMQELEDEASTEMFPQLRGMLGAFLFRDDDVYKKISVLSGGERSRLLLLKLLLKSCNLLICDEPTNHLDMASKNILLDALLHYHGTLLFVSHDRYFIESLAQKIVEIKDHAVKVFKGDYRYYLEKREQTDVTGAGAAGLSGVSASAAPAAGAADLSGAGACTSPGTGSVTPGASIHGAVTSGAEITKAGTGEYKPKSDRRPLLRFKNRLKNLEQESTAVIHEFENLERRQSDLENSLTREEVYTDGKRMKELKQEIERLEEQKSRLLERWQEIEDEARKIRENLH